MHPDSLVLQGTECSDKGLPLALRRDSISKDCIIGGTKEHLTSNRIPQHSSRLSGLQ